MSETIESLGVSVSQDPIDQLKKAVVTYDAQLAKGAARQFVEQGRDPLEAFDALTAAIRIVGDGFGVGDLFLPELVGASEAMSAAVPILDEEIRRRGAKRESVGTVVIGTVQGDIHSIGETMVATLLAANGFEVHDLGIDVPAERFLEAVKTHKPDILALSALLTTTAAEQRKVIKALQDEGLKEQVKVMVGGGAITPAFAEAIGADGYDPTAPGAVELAKKLLA